MTLVNRKHNTRSTAAALLPASCGAFLILMSSPAAATVECHMRKGGDGSYWSWREIEGRRCWYRGHRGMNKHALRWPAAEPARTPPRQSADRPPAPRPPDIAADAGAVLNTIGDRWPEADWTAVLTIPGHTSYGTHGDIAGKAAADQALLDAHAADVGGGPLALQGAAPIDSVAAVTAAPPSRFVPNAGAPEPATTDRRHQSSTPKKDTGQGRSPAVTIAVLMVSLGMIGAGAFLIRIRT